MKKNEGESMGIELQSILEGMKRLRAASSKIRETESELTFFITDIEKVQIQKFIREISYLDGFFTFKVMYEESEEYFKGGKYLDFSLELISNPGCFCDEHEAEFLELKKREEERFTIKPFKRFGLYKDISNCEECRASAFEYSFTIHKQKLLSWFSEKFLGEPFPSGVKVLIWSTIQQLKDNYTFFDVYKNSPRPFLIIICEGEIHEQDGYLNMISATLTDFNEKMKNLKHDLEIQKAELQNILEKQTYFKIDNSDLKFFPPEFWIDKNTKELGELNEIKKKILNIENGFFLSLIWAISDKVVYDVDTNEITFSLEKDYIVKLNLELENGKIKMDTESLIIDKEKELIRWYEACLYSKYSTSNMKVIKDTIIVAGDANFLSIIRQPEKLIRYYEFHYENLLAEKLKERSDIVKTFVNNSQSLKNKLINDTGEVTKNCINIVTVLLGLLLSFALIYSRSATAGLDFAFFIIVLFSLVYIPINIYRIINIMDLANDTIKCFYQDMGVLNKIYGYDFHEIVNMKPENYYAEKKLKKGVSIVMIFMGGLQGVLVYLIVVLVWKAYQKIIFNNFIESTLFLVLFFIVFGTEIIWLASGFFKKKRIVDEHKEIKEDVKK
ncbi:tRNA modification GTPase [Bacillus luti]|uniref:tRNA modification GTPase n=2 Tax=Bacillus cereus group TaxID=86661 RepID=A0A7V7SAE7_9BACI|nr:tRNA modification GTPase [Bacillus luti]KAB2444715.1 tRNA modification GTPase [Bacillus luti]